MLPQILPPAMALHIAKLLDRTCGAPAEMPRRHDPLAIIQSFARERFAAGCDAVVTGHFHQPFHQRDAGREIVSLGDWINQYSYAELVDGAFTLHTYQGP
jgi:UDP-2,3-diacylglucosamine hydrolase